MLVVIHLLWLAKFWLGRNQSRKKVKRSRNKEERLQSRKLTKIYLADSLWNELGNFNNKVEHHFRQLSSLYEQDPTLYNSTIESCAQLKSTEWHTVSGTVAEEIVALVKDFNHVRSLLQKMSELSDVPVEPKEQTRLLDECTNVPGVAMAGVPGAGGYDAIFCIVLSKEAKNDVFKVWESWKELSVGPLLSQADSNGVTSVTLDSVPGLAKILL
jgi:phosphomevalonate kinase